jgi:hypothetical protein
MTSRSSSFRDHLRIKKRFAKRMHRPLFAVVEKLDSVINEDLVHHCPIAAGAKRGNAT